jgi:hypothetical protein
MTAKEKAEDLIDSFVRDGYDIVMSEKLAKRFALIAVNEILTALEGNHWQNKMIIDYYSEVNNELEKL